MKNERILFKANKKSIYIWTILLLVLAFSVIACTNFISNTKIVNAESPYEGQFVNFNQLISTPIKIINNNITSSYFDSITNFQYIANHKIFIKSNFDSNVSGNLLGLGNAGSVYEYIKGDYIFQYNGGLNFNSIIFKSGLQAGTYYINFIDLTAMYGEGLEIDLEKCKELFTADYYGYTTGAPEVYYPNAGANSLALTKSLDFVLTSGNLVKNDLYGTYVSLNTSNGDTQLFTDVAYNVESEATAQVIYRFNTTIPAGAKITIQIDHFYCLKDFYLLNDNSGDHIGSITHQNSYVDSYIQFFLQSDMSQLSINFWSNGSTGTPAITWSKFTITAEYVTNMSILLQDAYNNGVKDTKEFYSEGNLGYEQIFNLGVASVGGDAYNIFPDSWTFIGNAFSSIGDMLSMEIFPKVPLGLFVALPLLLGLIMFIVKIAKGGS